MINNTVVSERFRKSVVLHIFKNYTPTFSGTPLILGIHGPSGEGKTYQCQKVLEEMDVRAFLVSGGQLEGSEAGEPARLLRATYLQASRAVEDDKVLSVLLINDVDTGVGNWGDLVQYTVNRQTVFGELMHFVDYPTKVDGRSTRRIPIILTGNDFTKLYEPLVRAGRMTAFEWKPDGSEKVSVLAGIFPELTEQECRALVEEFNAQPVAFFSHLRSTLADDDVWREIKKIGLRTVSDYLRRGVNADIRPEVTLESLIALGREIQSSSLQNHLRRN